MIHRRVRVQLRTGVQRDITGLPQLTLIQGWPVVVQNVRRMVILRLRLLRVSHRGLTIVFYPRGQRAQMKQARLSTLMIVGTDIKTKPHKAVLFLILVGATGNPRTMPVASAVGHS